MRIRKTAEPEESANVQRESKSPPQNPIDLRPFRRIGCFGSKEAIASFVVAATNACLDHGQVFAFEKALDGLIDALDMGNLTVVHETAMIPSLLRDETTSLLIFALRAQEPLVREVDAIFLAGEESQNTISPRVIFIDSAVDVDCLLVLDDSGERQLFVRPEFNKPVATQEPSEQRLPESPPEVLFDRTVRGPQVGIAVLGPVGMTGTNYPLERHPKLTELVVYLTLHPEGATSRNWTTALWPERRVPAQTVANRLSEARRIVGFASDGRPRLRRNGERHCLVEFNSDWSDFQRLAASDAPESWRQALELVRGRPFDELAQGQWVVFEGFLAEIERAIASVALMLGDIALEAGDAELTAWAAQQALKACPFDERLHRMLMRAADALGNRAGVESTLRQLALILEIDGDPLHGVHPKTAKLYHELTATAFSRA